MNYNYNDRFNVQVEPRVCDGKEFQQYIPDYTSQNDFYRVEDQPINIMDNALQDNIIENVAQQQLLDVSSDSLDTSGLSDKQLIETALPRYAEVSDLEDVANSNLRDLDKAFKELKKDKL